jgi:purine-binding chemotaxis protein CheW
MSAPALPVKHVCFSLRGQLFGADIAFVKETVELGPLTRVFLVDPCIAGVMSLRGDIVAIVDLAQFLGMAGAALPGEHQASRRVLIAQEFALGRSERGKKERTAGLLVDQLDEVRLLDAAQILAPPPAIDAAAAAYLRGVVSLPAGPLGVLDLQRVLRSERFRPYARA